MPRLEALLDMITKFIDEGMIPSDGGWAKVTDADMTKFNAIVSELIDLKVARDPDGDRTVTAYFENRNSHPLYVIDAPAQYDSLDGMTTEEAIEKTMEYQHVANLMSGYVANCYRNAEQILKHIHRQNSEKRRFSDGLIRYRDRLVAKEPFDSLVKDWLIFSKSFKGADEHEINEMKALIAIFYPKEFEEAVANIAIAGQINDEGHYYATRSEWIAIFGQAFTDDSRVSNLHDRLDAKWTKERSERLAARRAARSK